MSTSESYAFDIEDTAPLITYVPPPLGPIPEPDNDLTDGWQTQFDGVYLNNLGQTGLGNATSTHVTSRDGASFNLTFTGSSITLVGLANDSSYDVSLDGLTSTDITPQSSSSDPTNPFQVLYTAQNLAPVTHTLQLVVHAPNNQSSFVALDKAIVHVESNRTSKVATAVIPSTSLSFVGSWSFQQQPPAAPLFSDTSLLAYHQSSTNGDHATFTFSKTSPRPVTFSILGVLNFLNGMYQVTLSESGGSSVSQIFNGSFGWECGSELFLASGLEQATGELTVRVTNLEDKPLMIAGLNVTTAQVSPQGGASTSLTPSSTASPSPTASAGHKGLSISVPTGTLIALILSCICLVALISLSLCFFLRIRRRRRLRKAEMMQNGQARHSDAAVAVSEKSKSSSSESVLDIGRRVQHSRSGSTTGGDGTTDRWTPAPHSLRRSRHLSFPRTVMTTSDRNGAGGGGATAATSAASPGYGQPYANYAYGGPSLKARDYSPFIFSFDTSNSNSNKSRSRSQSDDSGPFRVAKEQETQRRHSDNNSTTPGETLTTTDPRSSYQTRERSSTFTKLTGEAKSTFLDLDYSRPQTSTEDPDLADRSRSSRDVNPPDVPLGVSAGDEFFPTDSRPMSAELSPPTGQIPPRIIIPRKPPPLSSPPPEPPLPPLPPPALRDSGDISSGSSPIPGTIGSRSSQQHPYVYGYAYQPSVSGDESEGAEQQLAQSSSLLPTTPHPYARPTTPPPVPNIRRVSHPPELSPIETAASGETEMIFSHPDSADGTHRRKPPGIELGEVMTDED